MLFQFGVIVYCDWADDYIFDFDMYLVVYENIVGVVVDGGEIFNSGKVVNFEVVLGEYVYVGMLVDGGVFVLFVEKVVQNIVYLLLWLGVVVGCDQLKGKCFGFGVRFDFGNEVYGCLVC